MHTLANILERFNRKERNLLIRDILDCRDEPMPLASDFRERLAKAVGVSKECLDGAWWATDFHFDWLAGALLTFMKAETQRRQENHPKLVMGNQEDLDLVVVAHAPAATRPQHLILIEAKAYGHFSTEQYRSKVARLEALYAFYRELERESPHRISFHYVLYSPTRPTKLVPMPLPWQSNDAAVLEHINLKLAVPRSSILSVTRCNDNGVPDIEGAFWRCIRPHETGFSAYEDASSEASSFPMSDVPANSL